ncbi:MAG: hypothetical protein GWN00_30785, partial [Aliifodinibius sp.]|nr:hypothetical protein [Fodinibius sp.]NIY29013.1 hypothetical protein [Fodinibius sp.]
MDSEGNFLVAWEEHGTQVNIMGQFYDSTGTAIGKNFVILDNDGYRFPKADVLSTSPGKFLVSWKADSNIWTNQWRYEPILRGSYVSSVHDVEA